MNIEVGSCEAITKLPELLRRVRAGQRYSITLRGEAVADLVPPKASKGADAAADEMLAFMRSRRAAGGGIDFKELIGEGRA
jgi:antitoxin (DNA-binding transcriptional repressor) of toxin-antitoxin stability system